jgi:hypothetical protein
MAVVGSGHGLGLSGSVLTLHVTRCGGPRLINGPCGRSFGIMYNDRGLYLKLKGRGMVFELLIWPGGFSPGRISLGSHLGSHSFLLFVTHSLQVDMKVRISAFCLQGTPSPRT